MSTTNDDRRKVTVPDLASWKTQGRRMTMITAYDFTFARLVDLAVSTILMEVSEMNVRRLERFRTAHHG